MTTSSVSKQIALGVGMLCVSNCVRLLITTRRSLCGNNKYTTTSPEFQLYLSIGCGIKGAIALSVYGLLQIFSRVAGYQPHCAWYEE